MKESTYWDRTDRFEDKLRLLESAWTRRDFKQARALAESLRHTLRQAQHEEENPGAPLMPSNRSQPVDSLPGPWREWAKGWTLFQVANTDETTGQRRPPEPVELLVSFPSSSTMRLAREIRVASVEGGLLREVPCQVYGEVRRGPDRLARVVFLTGSAAHTRSAFLILAGNPDAELPAYVTDLRTTGDGIGLDIENDFFRASLSRQMGQLERLTFKREHNLELFAGGEGHGEPPGIDWAHDYVTSGNFQKMRVTLWDECPDYQVIRGPLCTIVRRWGFPASPVHPVFSPSRLHVFVEYRFYAGLPWFAKNGSMEVLKDVEIGYLRDDEWVFSGLSFTDSVWIGPDGKLHTGAVPTEAADDLWAVGFFNRTSRDAFVALFLEHTAQRVQGLKHTGAPIMHYRWHGHVWSRALFHNTTLPAGAVLRQRNAYLTLPFPEQGGAEMVEQLRHRLLNPLLVSEGQLARNLSPAAHAARLARPGEAGDSPISKRVLWDALRDCKDEQLYSTMPDVVELGLVYDLRVRGDAVHVVMTMPHRGRPRLGYFEYGSGGNSMPVRQRLMRVPGVRRVTVEQVWEPEWNSNFLGDGARRAFGL